MCRFLVRRRGCGRLIGAIRDGRCRGGRCSAVVWRRCGWRRRRQLDAEGRRRGHDAHTVFLYVVVVLPRRRRRRVCLLALLVHRRRRSVPPPVRHRRRWGDGGIACRAILGRSVARWFVWSRRSSCVRVAPVGRPRFHRTPLAAHEMRPNSEGRDDRDRQQHNGNIRKERTTREGKPGQNGSLSYYRSTRSMLSCFLQPRGMRWNACGRTHARAMHAEHESTHKQPLLSQEGQLGVVSIAAGHGGR